MAIKTIDELLYLYEQADTVHVKDDMRQAFKDRLDQQGAKYTVGWDGASQCYVFMAIEDKLL